MLYCGVVLLLVVDGCIVIVVDDGVVIGVLMCVVL